MGKKQRLHRFAGALERENLRARIDILAHSGIDANDAAGSGRDHTRDEFESGFQIEELGFGLLQGNPRRIHRAPSIRAGLDIIGLDLLHLGFRLQNVEPGGIELSLGLEERRHGNEPLGEKLGLGIHDLLERCFLLAVTLDGCLNADSLLRVEIQLGCELFFGTRADFVKLLLVILHSPALVRYLRLECWLVKRGHLLSDGDLIAGFYQKFQQLPLSGSDNALHDPAAQQDAYTLDGIGNPAKHPPDQGAQEKGNHGYQGEPSQRGHNANRLIGAIG